MTALQWETLQLALRAARGLRRRPGVIGVGIGQRHKHGRWLAGPPCIVVKVDWKRSRELLRKHRRQPIPEWISVAVRGRHRRVRVDVQETRGQLTGRLQGLTAGPVAHDGERIGSVSAMVQTNDGARLAMISGHVARTAGRTLSIAGVTGTAREPIFTSRMDHCLVDLAAVPAGAELLDDRRLSGITPVSSLHVDKILYFNHSATGQRVPVVLRHVNMSAPFEYPDGTRELQGLLVTDGASANGDSGALLYDNGFGAVGTLVGLLGGESYFLPCDSALPTLGVTLY